MPNGDDKNWIRLCLTIAGFNTHFGHWPTQIRTYAGIIDDLRDYLFGAEDFKQIKAKLAFVADEDALMIAEDTAGGSYTYGSDHPGEQSIQQAAAWLGIYPKHGGYNE